MIISFIRKGKAVYAILFGLLFGLGPFNPARSQAWEIGAFAGGAFYHGELTPTKYLEYYRLLRPAGGLSLRYSPAPWLGIRLGATAMTLHGGARYTPYTVYRGQPVVMRTPVRELALAFEMSPFDIRLLGLAVRPYLYAGVAVFGFQPQLYFEGDWIDPQPLGTEGQGVAGYPAPYATTRAVLPLGTGLRFTLSRHLVLGLELHARLPFTDYLDDISGRLVDYADLLSERSDFIARLSNPAATELTGTYRRGNLGKDAYFFTGVGFYYRLSDSRSRRVRCPES